VNLLSVAVPCGRFRILLDDQHAPVTSAYFADLARQGALDTAAVFRVLSEKNQSDDGGIKISVVQIGMADGLDAPRTKLLHEHTQLTGLRHRRWSVSAARFGPGELYGSFFVCMRDEPALDFGGARQEDGQGFAAFGRVVDGFETLEKLHARAEDGDMLTRRIQVEEIEIMQVSQHDIAHGLLDID
jgi:peptidyl-prolyl cis-trans isomerase A (cyclophilin A)